MSNFGGSLIVVNQIRFLVKLVKGQGHNQAVKLVIDKGLHGHKYALNANSDS